MGKYKYWEMDNYIKADTHTITKTLQSNANPKEQAKQAGEEGQANQVTQTANPDQITFTVQRFKDNHTKREQITIAAKVGNDDSGEIPTNLVDLSNDIVKFKMFGVVLPRAEYVELCQLIEKEYYLWKPIYTNTVDNVVSEEIANEVFDMFCEYIHDKQLPVIKVRGIEDFYGVDLLTFSKELADSEFKKYRVGDIKEALHKLKYTVANKGKFDYNHKINKNDQQKKVGFKVELVTKRLEKLATATVE